MKDDIKEKLKNKRIAAIDYGTKRIGIAVCDELHISCNPIKTIDIEKENLKDELSQIIIKERISAVVIGLPISYDDTENTLITKIKSFAEFIKKEFSFDIYYIDESYSSKNASDYMVEYGIKKSNRVKKGTIDKFAAVIILQRFLQEME